MKIIILLLLFVGLLIGISTCKTISNGGPSVLYLYTLETPEYYYYFVSYNITNNAVKVNLAQTPKPLNIYSVLTQSENEFSFLFLEYTSNVVGIINYSYETNKFEITSEFNYGNDNSIIPFPVGFSIQTSFDQTNNIVYTIAECLVNGNVSVLVFDFNTQTSETIVFDSIYLYESYPSGILDNQGNYLIHYFDVYGDHTIIKYNINDKSSTLYVLDKNSFFNQNIQLLTVVGNSIYAVDEGITQPYIIDYTSGTVKPITYQTAGGTLGESNTIMSIDQQYITTFGINYNPNSTYASASIKTKEVYTFQTPILTAAQLYLFSAQ